MDIWKIPSTGFLRLNQIIKPHGVFPISRSAWYDGIAKGKYPEGIKLGPRTVAWRTEDVLALIKRSAGE